MLEARLSAMAPSRAPCLAAFVIGNRQPSTERLRHQADVGAAHAAKTCSVDILARTFWTKHCVLRFDSLLACLATNSHRHARRPHDRCRLAGSLKTFLRGPSLSQRFEKHDARGHRDVERL